MLETVLKNVYKLDTGRKSILDPEDDTAKALTQLGFVQTVPTWGTGWGRMRLIRQAEAQDTTLLLIS